MKFCILILFIALNISGEDLYKIYTEDTPPFNFINTAGEVDGYSTEIIREIQRRIGDNSKIEVLPWSRAYNLTKQRNNPNTILYSTAYSNERSSLFHWVGPIYENTWTFYSLSKNDINIDSLEDARRVGRIGVYASDIREQFLLSEGFDNIARFRGHESIIQALLAGRVDIILSSKISLIHLIEKEGVDISLFKPLFDAKSSGLYIVFSLDTSALIVDIWREAYYSMVEDGTVEKIANKWNLSMPKGIKP